MTDSPTPSEPRTLKDAGDCGGAYHFGLCQSCGAYFAVAEAAEPAALDVERQEAILSAAEGNHTRDWNADHQGGHNERDWRKCDQWPCSVLARLQSPDPQP